MKIWNLSQLTGLEKVDQRIVDKMRGVIEVLNENYGESREVDGLGGYVLLSTTSIQPFEKFIKQYPTVVPEFMDYFIGIDGVEYVEILFLLSSDDSVMAYLNANEFKNQYQALILLGEED